jgi:small GTP-binding protein
VTMRYTFKLIIAGDGGVGKTTLVDRYVSGTFNGNSRITLGAQFMVKRLIVGGDAVDLQIWDFGGEDRFRFILPAYCRGAHGAIFMYDVTNLTSLYHVDDWMKILYSQKGKFPIVAAGTKADLTPGRKVSEVEARDVVGRYGISEIFEVSSKSGQNVAALFDTITRTMIQSNHLEQQSPRTKIIVTTRSMENTHVVGVETPERLFF